MNQAAMNAQLLRARIEFRLNRLPIDSANNGLREELWQEHSRLSKIISENQGK